MNYKILIFALLFGGIFLCGCSSKKNNNKTTSNLEFGKENTQFRNTETKNRSPYAMFGDSIVVVNAGQGKPAKNKSRFEALVSNSFNNKINANLTSTGALKMSFAKGQSLETLTREELAFYNVLDQASNGKNINGEDVDVEIKVVFSPSGHEKQLVSIGQAETGKIDIDDMEMFPQNGTRKLTQRALLGHEIKEQYEMQVSGKIYADAHNDALMSDILVQGFQRIDQPKKDWIKANKIVGDILISNDGSIKIYRDENLNVKKVEQ